MIVFIFTLDYELYGDGSGSLRSSVLEPADILLAKFDKHGVPLVIFVEAAEFEVINQHNTDKNIEFIIRQIRSAYKNGHEIGLHLHPQWYNASYESGRWKIDVLEYNLCVLSQQRIETIVSRAINFIRYMINDYNFTPVSFRAGNWLFQPTQPAAKILYDNGIRIDSSVFKWGRFDTYGVDYSKSGRNGYYWKFNNDVNINNPDGFMTEVPIYVELVPFWKMLTSKRLKIDREPHLYGHKRKNKIINYYRKLRLKYPKKLDYCRMNARELRVTLDRIKREDERMPDTIKPIVAIGHTKDLRDLHGINFILEYLSNLRIRVSTFRDSYKYLI